MAKIDDIKKATEAIKKIVAEMGQRSTARSGRGENLANMAGTIEDDIAEGIAIRAAVTQLADTIKNAEATLAKIENQNKKDLNELAKSGGGGKDIDSRTPFVMETRAVLDSLEGKLGFALTDFTNLGRVWQSDRTFATMEKSKPIIAKIRETCDEIDEAVKQVNRLTQASY